MITGSVGQGGQNRRQDVIQIQQLLNKNLHKLTPLRPLSVDGLAGPKTVGAIIEYQRRVVGLSRPDGRVDPHGKTLASFIAPPGVAQRGLPTELAGKSGLSTEVAREVVRAVSNDPECRKSISSVLAYFLPPDKGWTGGVRNFLMVFADIPNYALEEVVNAYRRSSASKGDKTERYVAPKNFPPNAPHVDRIICTGIAEATANTINRVLTSSRTLSQHVQTARMESRRTGIAHAGTLLQMVNGSQFIFDWHMTLQPENPLIFRAEDWHNRRSGVLYSRFNGFD
jgi:peptidoglycan hydrolase-like protein with peptidoglycan-binding domain